jgi:outer membrane protein assembly factor BamB
MERKDNGARKRSGMLPSFLLALLATGFAVSLASGQLAPSAWPMLDHDLQHTSLSPFNPVANPVLRWDFEVNGTLSSPAIGTDGTIYLGCDDDNLYAFTDGGTSGIEKWKFLTGDEVESSPAIGADGTVYVGSDDDNLYAITDGGSTGIEKWLFPTGGAVESSPAISTDGTIYIGSDDDNVYAINPNGSEKWVFATGRAVESSPAIGTDGAIYIGSLDGNIYALNPDGSEEWTFPAGIGAIGPDGTIYAPYALGGLVAVNPDGTQKWQFALDFESAPAIGANGTIYIGSEVLSDDKDEDVLYAINPDGSGEGCGLGPPASAPPLFCP